MPTKCTQSKCCCNCGNQLKLMKHPMNRTFGKGSIMDKCGYVCITPLDDNSNKGKAIYFDSEHGECEMWFLRK